MTATIVLIRHAAHAEFGRVLSGRAPGIPLSDIGRAQAETLARRLSGLPLAAMHTSPVQRARETADAIRAGRDVPCTTVDALEEIDFGSWTGRSFAELDRRPDWTAWNQDRGSARAAEGETMVDAQARIVRHIEQVARNHAGKTVAMVSHCDLIRAAIAHYLALPLASLLNFDIDPASASRLAVGDWGGRVLSINETHHECSRRSPRHAAGRGGGARALVPEHRSG